MIKRLAHASLISQDLEQTEKFYCGALGLEKKFEFRKNGNLYGFYLNAGEQSFLEIFLDFEVRPQGRIQHICLEVENLDKVIDALRALGVECPDKQMGADQTWQCWIRDPDGVRIELQEYTKRSSQFTGANCES